MSMNAKQRFEMKRFVKELSQYRGRHTELVSVYIPAGYDINKIRAHIAQEQGTATNIKSTSTRKNVTDALERMIQHLNLYKMTPEHGLAAFSGNVAEREGQSDVRVWSIEPPLPIKTRLYRCDKEFQLQILDDMLDDKEIWGFVVMDRRESNIALLKGKSIIPLYHEKSNVPGKTKAGGQSAARYMRIREDAAKDFYKEVATQMKEAFLPRTELKGIIVGGPGPSKFELIDSGYITGDVKKKIVAVKDISYTGDFGIQELLDRSADVLAGAEVAEEKKIMQKFFETLATQPDKATYGRAYVEKAIDLGVADVVLLSEALPEDDIALFEGKAERFSTRVEIISTETREGVQLRELGMYGAILRYPLSIEHHQGSQ
jgi:peptide chain release factor subunit 1